jgi:hypothetical protein
MDYLLTYKSRFLSAPPALEFLIAKNTNGVDVVQIPMLIHINRYDLTVPIIDGYKLDE